MRLRILFGNCLETDSEFKNKNGSPSDSIRTFLNDKILVSSLHPYHIRQ